jgi:hypothetical protein
MSQTNQRKSFEFRYTPLAASPDAVLVEFLQTGTGVRKGKELMLQAIRAHWLAIAHQHSNREPEQVRAFALDCCQALREQIRYLETHFGLLQAPHSLNGAPTIIAPQMSTEDLPDRYGLNIQASSQERRSFLSS